MPRTLSLDQLLKIRELTDCPPLSLGGTMLSTQIEAL
jgi:hypothetical protein